MLDILAKAKLYFQRSTVTDSKVCQLVTVLNDMEDMVSINILQKPKQTLITQFLVQIRRLIFRIIHNI